MLVVCVCTLTVSFKPLLIQSFFFLHFFNMSVCNKVADILVKKKQKKTTEGQMSSGLF